MSDGMRLFSRRQLLLTVAFTLGAVVGVATFVGAVDAAMMRD